MITLNHTDKTMSLQFFYIRKSKFFIIIIWLCFQFVFTAEGQDSLKQTTVVSSINMNEDTKVSEDSLSVVNITPAGFPGGKTEWIRYLVHNLLVPEEMRGTKFNRSIVVKFTVDEKGRLKNFEDAGKDPLKKEAIRVVKESGKWIPAYGNSRPISSECERTITFQWNTY